jgi:hypothetical protein
VTTFQPLSVVPCGTDPFVPSSTQDCVLGYFQASLRDWVICQAMLAGSVLVTVLWRGQPRRDKHKNNNGD